MRTMELVAPSRLRERVTPAPDVADLGPGEVLVAVTVGGICGSDLPHFRGAALGAPVSPPPGYPLHETAGIAIASRHRRIRPGDPVVGWASRFDGMAEYVISRGSELHVHDAAWTAEQAMTIQPLACVLYAVRRLGDVRGLRVSVLGLGAIGLMFAQTLTARGAHVLGVDRVDRTEATTALGLPRPVVADAADWVDTVADGDRPHVVVDAIGHDPALLAAAVHAVRPRGRIYAFGVPDEETYPLPVAAFLRKNLTLLSGITLDRSRMLGLAEDHLRRHPQLADVAITDVVPLEDAQLAFERALTPRAGQLKVLLSMGPGGAP